MAKPRRINTSQIIKDIRSGLDHQQLMNKYSLSLTQFNRTLQKLVNAQMVTKSDIKHLIVKKKREVRLDDFARDLRQLMIKYGISAKQAQSLLHKVRESQLVDESDTGELTVAVHKKKKRRINAREFAEDIQLGLDNANLMMKYHLSENQLETVVHRLIDAKLLTEAEVYDRSVPFDTQLIEAEVVAQAAIDELD
jgi:uncharacterized protein (DUF433 family)